MSAENPLSQAQMDTPQQPDWKGHLAKGGLAALFLLGCLVPSLVVPAIAYGAGCREVRVETVHPGMMWIFVDCTDKRGKGDVYQVDLGIGSQGRPVVASGRLHSNGGSSVPEMYPWTPWSPFK